MCRLMPCFGDTDLTDRCIAVGSQDAADDGSADEKLQILTVAAWPLLKAHPYTCLQDTQR
jgi:hypothetical protein